MKVQFENTQVWPSTLQSAANPVKIGTIFYSASIFDIRPVVERISEVLYEETKQLTEISLKKEIAFKDDEQQIRWYDIHDIRNNREHLAEAELLKSASIHVEAKNAHRVANHFLHALSSISPLPYLLKGIEQRLIPEPGILVNFELKRDFSAYVSDTVRLHFIQNSVVGIKDFNSEAFFKPISRDKTSPFFISPYMMCMEMPMSSTDSEPAFIQLGRIDKTSEQKRKVASSMH
eukprot:15366147-Ditylum_brightwellii.AAC.1